MIAVEPSQITVRRAATVLLVRDGARGVEVFMLRRNPESEFVGGAYVFPGGAVDEHDHHHALADHCVGITDSAASAVLGVEGGGLAFWVAAIRETFEECGLLLAYDRSGELVRFDAPDVVDRFADLRRRVDTTELTMADLCRLEGLTLACDTMHYLSHWITPVGPPRRYDTRFFVARAPDAQAGRHDDREAVDSVWIRPEEALERGQTGDLQIIMPTASNLEAIAGYGTADEVLVAAAEQRATPAPRPHLAAQGEQPRARTPGDAGYQGAIS
jgi:8-oxo-dGTP pyrophosphatase MutT (NUDIX family)